MRPRSGASCQSLAFRFAKEFKLMVLVELLVELEELLLELVLFCNWADALVGGSRLKANSCGIAPPSRKLLLRSYIN